MSKKLLLAAAVLLYATTSCAKPSPPPEILPSVVYEAATGRLCVQEKGVSREMGSHDYAQLPAPPGGSGIDCSESALNSLALRSYEQAKPAISGMIDGADGAGTYASLDIMGGDLHLDTTPNPNHSSFTARPGDDGRLHGVIELYVQPTMECTIAESLHEAGHARDDFRGPFDEAFAQLFAASVVSRVYQANPELARNIDACYLALVKDGAVPYPGTAGNAPAMAGSTAEAAEEFSSPMDAVLGIGEYDSHALAGKLIWKTVAGDPKLAAEYRDATAGRLSWNEFTADATRGLAALRAGIYVNRMPDAYMQKLESQRMSDWGFDSGFIRGYLADFDISVLLDSPAK